ncbi:ABC transporter permease [Arsenicitalea aurantiaca]|uniref:ABC transporter permease n=1 Tax=Arsenicitalea aurantiaca TaxID=1783274 RepID=A0A433XB53_9HYPH|nr:ABC transporter permease [Arsenicitalea aurantiaca]RUT31292.1 ABC transporter permease [Arsenicitalea aurantiaca]
MSEPTVQAAADAALLDQQVDASRLQGASQWGLIWHKFRRHKLAVFSLVVVGFIYFVALFAEFLAPTDPGRFDPRYTYAPPQSIGLFVDGSFQPHVKGYSIELDQASFRRVFVVDPDVTIPIGLFVRGQSYRMWGLFETDLHFIGPLDPSQPFFLMGADRLGRDMLSRTIHGTRISMSIGLVGVGLSLVIGMILGGISGYYGGFADRAIQRVIEFIRSIPTIPLWLGLAAAMPREWPPLQVYFAILVILSLIGWTEIARVVRGRFLSLRGDDFVIAARLDGVSEYRLIMKHMMPSLYSHIIAAITLAIPNMILAETALSFLGLGLQPPIVSWGVLLQDTQNLRAITQAPWLFIPGICVVVAVLALNFLGDGVRDAADPYAK